MMRDVIRHGTGRGGAQARAHGPVRQDRHHQRTDRCLVRRVSTPISSTISWVGFDKLKPMGHTETGAHAALPMWIDFMGTRARRQARGDPPKRPDDIVTVQIDPETGQRALGGGGIPEIFRPGQRADGGRGATFGQARTRATRFSSCSGPWRGPSRIVAFINHRRRHGQCPQTSSAAPAHGAGCGASDGRTGHPRFPGRQAEGGSSYGNRCAPSRPAEEQRDRGCAGRTPAAVRGRGTAGRAADMRRGCLAGDAICWPISGRAWSGDVLSGLADAHSDIQLHVFAEHSECFDLFLQVRGFLSRSSSGVIALREGHRFYPAFRFVAGEHRFEATLFSGYRNSRGAAQSGGWRADGSVPTRPG